jgi:hypothetical protein
METHCITSPAKNSVGMGCITNVKIGFFIAGTMAENRNNLRM